MAARFVDMSPYQGDELAGGHEAELHAAQLIREALPESATVYRGVECFFGPEADASGLSGEADLIVVWPERGVVLVIEVKSGQIMAEARPGPNGTMVEWARLHPNGDRESLHPSPFQQAYAVVRQMLAVLKRFHPRHQHHGILVLACCALPDCEFVQPTGLNVDPFHLSAPDFKAGMIFPALERLVRNKVEALNLFQPRAMGKDAQEILRRLVGEEVRSERRIGHRLADLDGRTLIESAEQANLAEVLSRVPLDFGLQGGAGTGKTVLLRLVAGRCAQRGERVLLLCYNALLAAHLRAEFKTQGDVRVLRMEEFVEWLAGREMADAAARHLTETGFEAEALSNRILDAFLERLDEAAPGSFQIDRILIDEGQDVTDEMHALIGGFRDFGREPAAAAAPILAAFDPCQDIFVQQPRRWIAALPTIRLRRNLRNSDSISRFFWRFLPKGVERGEPTVRHGPEPRIHEFGTPEMDDAAALRAQGQLIEKVLKDLVNGERIDAGSITVLGLHSNGAGALPEMPPSGGDAVLRFAGFPAVWARQVATGPGRPAGALRLATVQSFKGLEDRVVVLCDVGLKREGSRAYQAHNLYVGASRARVLLVVLQRKGWRPGG